MSYAREVSKIDDGLFLCGAHGLVDSSHLLALNVKHILNVAGEDLYQKRLCEYDHTMSDDDGITLLADRLSAFEIKVMGADDVESEDLSPLFVEMADSIDAGRKAGGIVVHCAMGVSRSAAAVLAYLMLKEGLSLQAAFYKVHQVRDRIRPNNAFWKQLRDLEASLVESGASLRELQDQEMPDDTKKAAAKNFMRVADYQVKTC
eukprot:TRINITY_DN43418_c0_g1_i1.p1 TRINITY_DN43418_c0_g1~~TRINITY_DN43418_c0_g1_i1.p1  ORF type:complete len:204 (-),score=30.33 TRINITY_DN43418_c0_g1_i1:31-642(-)